MKSRPSLKAPNDACCFLPIKTPAWFLSRLSVPLLPDPHNQGGVYGEVARRSPDAAVIVPPRSSAVPSDTAGTASTQRDRHLQMMSEHGRRSWQKASGYHWRVLVKADISRFKRVIGNGLRSRTDRRRSAEIALAVGVLNKMLELGRQEYVRLA